jgi:hypothetical protein
MLHCLKRLLFPFWISLSNGQDIGTFVVDTEGYPMRYNWGENSPIIAIFHHFHYEKKRYPFLLLMVRSIILEKYKISFS